MKRASGYKLEMFVVTIASSLFIVCAGCSSSGGSAAQAVTPASVSIPKGSRAVVTESDPIAAASANNMRDLASAQPDTVLTGGGSARDVDLGGGGDAASAPLTYQALGEALTKIGLTPEDDKDCYVMK